MKKKKEQRRHVGDKFHKIVTKIKIELPISALVSSHFLSSISSRHAPLLALSVFFLSSCFSSSLLSVRLLGCLSSSHFKVKPSLLPFVLLVLIMLYFSE